MYLRSVMIFTLALSGCGTTSGVREFQTYARAFDAVEDASDAVLNEIAASERREEISLLDSASNLRISETLLRQDIALFAPSADPPFVQSMRFAVASVAKFNDAMLAYAEGRAIGILTNQIGEIRAAGVGFEAPVAGAEAGFSNPIKKLTIGLEILANVGSREAFRSQLSGAVLELDNLLDVLINNSDTAFKSLTAPDFAELRNVRQVNSPEANSIRARISKKRAMLAEWLYLIQLSRSALADAVAAIEAPQSSSSRLVEAAVVAGDLMARADMIKRLATEN